MAVRGNYICMQCMAAKGYAETKKRAPAGWTHSDCLNKDPAITETVCVCSH